MTNSSYTGKTISAAALQALKQALTHIYWYKNDLRGFLTQSLSNSRVLTRLNWSDYKRNIVGSLVDQFANNEHIYQHDLLQLISNVCDITDFSHLRVLEDGDSKAIAAKSAVHALREQLQGHRNLKEELEKANERRKRNAQRVEEVTELRSRVNTYREMFNMLLKAGDPHNRGYLLEKILKGMFETFDLDPKASFRISGEQIDGAFTFEGTDYLLEAKWQSKLVNAAELDGLSGKVSRKLDNTLGLFLAINGYSEKGVMVHSTGRRLLILMDGMDLTAVLENRIDFVQLLRRKRRHASQTGNIYLRVHDIMS